MFDPALLAMYKSKPPPNFGPKLLSGEIAYGLFSFFSVDLKDAIPSLLRREYMKDPGADAYPSVKNKHNNNNWLHVIHLLDRTE